ncbi:S1C family serine protease [Bremerella sp. T1]|uniref:S1C family serine protease n=1 Tax=Bremerella sp. TYQ1 TaxID=3119568 RepID=UPI001CCA0643|nr:trypsin-like peptidase domain-containing protein [Bremerella volcania]UBM38558.1 S1C family serine protease [Bremerella volcania]
MKHRILPSSYLPGSVAASFRKFLIVCGLILCLPLMANAQDNANPQIQRTAHFAEILTGDAPDNVADLRSMEQQIQQVTKSALEATVGVIVGAAQGSGVIVSEDGLILTAGHVIGSPGREVTVILNDGSRVKGITLGMDRSIDSGAIQITTPGKYPYRPIRQSTGLREGEWVLVMGHAGGIVKDRKPALRLGRVLASSRDVIATDATLVGGDSGGPLLDIQGNVIGINSRIGNRITANLHVPSTQYLETIDRLKKSEVWGRIGGTQPYLGVRCDSDRQDVVVTRVTPDSPAATAGIQEGDEILNLNDRKINSFDDLKLMVNQYSPGDRIKVRIRRSSGNVITLEVELADRRELDRN